MGDCYDTDERTLDGEDYTSGDECVRACVAITGYYMANFGAPGCYCEFKAELESCDDLRTSSRYELWTATAAAVSDSGNWWE